MQGFNKTRYNKENKTLQGLFAVFKRLFLFLTLLLSPLYSSYTLQSTYMYENHTLMASTLFPEIQDDFKLLQIEEHKTMFRLRSDEIVERFGEHGITVEANDERYVTFIKRSPVDTEALEQALHDYFVEKLPGLVIRTVSVQPRSYTKALPEHYNVKIAPKTFHRNSGSFYIVSSDNKKYFFNFHIDADITYLLARKDLARKELLSPFNTLQKVEPFNRIRALPLTSLDAERLRMRHPIKAGRTILVRNTETLPQVRRNQRVHVTVKSAAVEIQFTANALQDGALHDIISIEKSDGRRLRAKVIGLNQVEIQ